MDLRISNSTKVAPKTLANNRLTRRDTLRHIKPQQDLLRPTQTTIDTSRHNLTHPDLL